MLCLCKCLWDVETLKVVYRGTLRFALREWLSEQIQILEITNLYNILFHGMHLLSKSWFSMNAVRIFMNIVPCFQTFVGSFGILGNILIILVLATKRMRKSFNLLLIVLSSFDILFIAIAILDYGIARGNMFLTMAWLGVICSLLWHG